MKSKAALLALVTAIFVAYQNCSPSGNSLQEETAQSEISKAQKSEAPDVANHPYRESKPIPGQYIVLFKDSAVDSESTAHGLVKAHGGKLLRSYKKVINGFAARLPDAAVAALQRNPHVIHIESDQTVSLNAIQTPTPNWGLDRIDQSDLPLNQQYQYSLTGTGVYAFVLDTGIWTGHVEFEDRLRPGMNFIDDTMGTVDCYGHGTHVAGIIASKTYGVAKKAFLVPVRVLNCYGSGAYSDIIAGLEYVANDPRRPAVANLSLGGKISDALDAAVEALVAQGVTVIAAAGNKNTDACTASPARSPSALTVGATSSLDYKASYSNGGPCVDLFAPGSNITSTYNTSNTSTGLMGGTSMAAPHVAGVVAIALEGNPLLTPAEITSLVLNSASQGKVKGLELQDVNLLLNSNLSLSGEPLPPPSPAPEPEPVPEPTPAIVKVSVKALANAGSVKVNKRSWQARALITVHDPATGLLVAQATVSGNFARAGGSGSCVTDSTGSCQIVSAQIKTSTASVDFSVSDISGSNMSYDSSKNLSSQITLSRP